MAKEITDLTKAQLDSLRVQLETARGELVVRPRTVPSARQPEVGDAMDAADRANEGEETGARNERDTAKLADIEHALGKFAKGEYGVSEDSGEPIGYGRLHALPWARLTVAEEEAVAKRRSQQA